MQSEINNNNKTMAENKIHIVIAECLGTDGEFSAEVYPCKTDKDAYDMGCSLIADMAETMSVENVNPETDWELYGNEWFYRVRVDTQPF